MTSLPRSLPAPLQPLAELALDLRWTWSHAGDTLWQRLDRDLWAQTKNPWLMLQLIPAASGFQDRLADQAQRARALATWEAQLTDHWPRLRFLAVQRRKEADALHVTADLLLGDVSPEHVRVELYADPVNGSPPVCEPMACEVPLADQKGGVRYAITLPTDRPADHFTPRVVPFHPSAQVPLELPLIRWP